MDINIMGYAEDLRTQTYVVYAQMNISDYLKLVGDNFDEFSIQRKKVYHKAYDRLRRDIIDGAILPAITLAIKSEYVDTILDKVGDIKNNYKNLEKNLIPENSVNILDGIQRTHILNDLSKEGIEFSQPLLVEFWFERNIKNLIYRLIVLNSGQKTMSMKHQIELLFLHIKDELIRGIPGIEIYTENENGKRSKACKYQFSLLAQAYQSFLTKNPQIDKENLIAREMVKENAFDSSAGELGDSFDDFKKYLKIYSDLDKEIYRIYKNKDNSLKNWFADENIIQAFFAALSKFGINDERKCRIDKSLKILVNKLQSINDDSEDNILGLDKYLDIRQGINPRKNNIGFETRRILLSSFMEYFREGGDIDLINIWELEAK